MKKNIVCYLTGAPATGKSSLCTLVTQHFPGVKVFSYSRELRNYINTNDALVEVDENTLRNKSAKIISKEDVDAVDKLLIDFIELHRRHNSLIIDSHAVTKENFGFRVTPFNFDTLTACGLDKIVCLYADPQIISKRISQNPEGRPLPNSYELEFHNHAQSSVAIQYSIALGKACYFLDSHQSREDLLTNFIEVTGIS